MASQHIVSESPLKSNSKPRRRGNRYIKSAVSEGLRADEGFSKVVRFQCLENSGILIDKEIVFALMNYSNPNREGAAQAAQRAVLSYYTTKNEEAKKEHDARVEEEASTEYESDCSARVDMSGGDWRVFAPPFPDPKKFAEKYNRFCNHLAGCFPMFSKYHQLNRLHKTYFHCPCGSTMHFWRENFGFTELVDVCRGGQGGRFNNFVDLMNHLADSGRRDEAHLAAYVYLKTFYEKK